MKKYASIACMSIILLFLVSSASFALNITISDQNIASSNIWYNNNDSDHNGSAYGNEDQEVEPGMPASQEWDMEAFLLEGTELSIISGYNMKDGYQNLNPGHLFIDINDDAQFGDVDGTSGNNFVQDTYGYDYVIAMNFISDNGGTYDIYKLNEESYTITSNEWQNQGSNPWRYDKSGDLIEEGLVFNFESGLTDEQVGDFLGDTHYKLSGIDLGFIAGKDFTAHYTMQCGNDNLMGQGTVPTPEPSSFILLGMGISAFLGYKKRQAKQ